jgi:D-threo-aldose 1-dehydrogenase
MTGPLAVRKLGRTDLQVTGLCVGTSPLASMPALYGYSVSEDQAIATVDAVLDSPIRFLDTSNGYGADGSAERRIGAAVRRRGGLPADFVLATKVDPDPMTGDFSGARVRASFAESVERLGVEPVQLLHLHDPERIDFADAMAPGGPVEALTALRDAGRVGYLGVAGGPVQLMRRYLDTGVFDVLLVHNRYTLLDRSAEQLFAAAHERGIGVLNAAPYGGGLLSRGPGRTDRYVYGVAPEPVRRAAAALQRITDAAGVPLAAAALQFSLRAPFVDSTVVGVSAPERVRETLELASTPIDEDVWAELTDAALPPDLWLDPP